MSSSSMEISLRSAPGVNVLNVFIRDTQKKADCGSVSKVYKRVKSPSHLSRKERVQRSLFSF